MSVMRSPRGVDSMTMGMTESGRAEDRREEGREREEVEGEAEAPARRVMPRMRDCRRKKVCIVWLSVAVCRMGADAWVGRGGGGISDRCTESVWDLARCCSSEVAPPPSPKRRKKVQHAMQHSMSQIDSHSLYPTQPHAQVVQTTPIHCLRYDRPQSGCHFQVMEDPPSPPPSSLLLQALRLPSCHRHAASPRYASLSCLRVGLFFFSLSSFEILTVLCAHSKIPLIPVLNSPATPPSKPSVLGSPPFLLPSLS